jgi:hypothetical protein
VCPATPARHRCGAVDWTDLGGHGRGTTFTWPAAQRSRAPLVPSSHSPQLARLHRGQQPQFRGQTLHIADAGGREHRPIECMQASNAGVRREQAPRT